MQRACTWSGPIFIAVFFGGILAARWLPPPPADQSAESIAAMYRTHTDGIRFGAALIAMSGFFQGVWAALMSRQMRRIEGDRPLFTYMQLAAGGVGILVVVFPGFAFATAAFTPGRDPQITAALHQFGFLCLVGMGWPAILQCVSVGLATLGDRREQPVFPRWFGWLNLWVAFGFAPGPFIVFFHTGAFAWNGAAAFWLPATVFGVWFAAWFVVLRRAIDEEAGEDEMAQAVRRELVGVA
jgi:MFS family permease